MRIFLDANVLFSGSNEASSVARLLHELRRNNTLLTSDLAREEARRNLARKRPHWLGGYKALSEHVHAVPSALFDLPVTLDSKDVPLLCAAIASRCDVFVTGDKRDFGHLYDRSVCGVKVLSLLALGQMLVKAEPG